MCCVAVCPKQLDYMSELREFEAEIQKNSQRFPNDILLVLARITCMRCLVYLWTLLLLFLMFVSFSSNISCVFVPLKNRCLAVLSKLVPCSCSVQLHEVLEH